MASRFGWKRKRSVAAEAPHILAKVVKEGYLFKQGAPCLLVLLLHSDWPGGKIRRKWQRRYFELRGNVLSYFTEKVESHLHTRC